MGEFPLGVFIVVTSPLTVSEVEARGERPIVARSEGRSLSFSTREGLTGLAFGFGPGFFLILEADVGGGGGADIVDVPFDEDECEGDEVFVAAIGLTRCWWWS